MLSELQKNLDNNTKSESKQRILFCSLFVFYSRNYGKEPLLLIRLLCSQKHKKGTEMQDNYTTKGKHFKTAPKFSIVFLFHFCKKIKPVFFICDMITIIQK